jgi:hypothetical protein
MIIKCNGNVPARGAKSVWGAQQAQELALGTYSHGGPLEKWLAGRAARLEMRYAYQSCSKNLVQSHRLKDLDADWSTTLNLRSKMKCADDRHWTHGSEPLRSVKGTELLWMSEEERLLDEDLPRWGLNYRNCILQNGSRRLLRNWKGRKIYPGGHPATSLGTQHVAVQGRSTHVTRNETPQSVAVLQTQSQAVWTEHTETWANAPVPRVLQSTAIGKANKSTQLRHSNRRVYLFVRNCYYKCNLQPCLKNR